MILHHGFELKKADVSGAFLQGCEQLADRYVVTHWESQGANPQDCAELVTAW